MSDWWDMWPQDLAQFMLAVLNRGSSFVEHFLDSPLAIFIGVLLFVAAAGVVARIGWIYIHKD